MSSRTRQWKNGGMMLLVVFLWMTTSMIAAQQDVEDYNNNNYGDSSSFNHPQYFDYPPLGPAGVVDPPGFDPPGFEGDQYGQEQQQDNLFVDYTRGKSAGIGLGRVVACAVGAWCVGARVHASRALKKLKSQYQKEQKALYSQYYNDVYKLTEQNTELAYMVEQLQTSLKDTKEKAELEALQRDYEEFKQPDLDGDDRISRAEFNMYVKNYLSNYPGLQEKDYPKFEDFDHDKDGHVSFKEYAQQMALQVQQAELEQYYATQAGGSGATSTKSQGLQELYKDMKKSDTYNRH